MLEMVGAATKKAPFPMLLPTLRSKLNIPIVSVKRLLYNVAGLHAAHLLKVNELAELSILQRLICSMLPPGNILPALHIYNSVSSINEIGCIRLSVAHI